MVVSSETAWLSVMVKSGASELGGADGHGNCGHMVFHFQFQAYNLSFCWGIPLQQGFNLEWPKDGGGLIFWGDYGT